MERCDGKTILMKRPCGREAKYVVGPKFACGTHRDQLVKLLVEQYPTVLVKKYYSQD